MEKLSYAAHWRATLYYLASSCIIYIFFNAYTYMLQKLYSLILHICSYLFELVIQYVIS